DLYKRGGQYEYTNGINWQAMGALLIGVAINLPGFLAAAIPGFDASEFWKTIYTYAWFVGFFVSGGLHVLFQWLNRKRGAVAQP
ncbi:MAG TPA: cytosine permease, partial [Polyangium sp.]|nr:cytosine permease [Polyangium sp.]